MRSTDSEVWGGHSAKIVGKSEPMRDPHETFSLPALSALLSLAVLAAHKLWQHCRPLLSLQGDLCLLPAHTLVLLFNPNSRGCLQECVVLLRGICIWLVRKLPSQRNAGVFHQAVSAIHYLLL